MKTIMLSLAFGLLIALTASGGEPCQTPACCTETCGAPDYCGHCGAKCCCQKYCQLVCTTKEVKKYCFVVHCEDFCAPLPNCPGGQKCCNCGQADCTQCRQCSSKSCDPCQVEYTKCLVPPKCGKVRTKKTLEKKEIVCKVPTYKCIVVYCCARCGTCMTPCNGEKAAAPAPAQTAPKQAAPKPAPQAPAPPVAPNAPQPKSTDSFPSMQNLLGVARAH
jgi:hypothetical protein